MNMAHVEIFIMYASYDLNNSIHFHLQLYTDAVCVLVNDVCDVCIEYKNHGFEATQRSGARS